MAAVGSAFNLDNFMRETLDASDAGLPILAPEEAIKILESLDVTDSLVLLSYVNLMLQRGGTGDAAVQSFLAQFFLPPENAERLFCVANSRGRAVGLFHPYNVRACLKLAWMYGKEGGLKLDHSTARHKLGHVLLSLSATTGCMTEPEPGPKDPQRHLYNALMCQHMTYMPLREHQRMGPSRDAILSDVFADEHVLSAFKSHHGMDPWEVVAAALILTSYFSHADTKSLLAKRPAPALDAREAFGIAGLPRRVGDQYLKDTVAEISERPHAEPARPKMLASSDYAFLVAKPFLHLGGGRIVCLDLEYAHSLLAYDLFRRTSAVLRLTTPTGIYNRQGPPFERFCQTVLRNAAKSRGARFVSSSNISSELDGAYQEGRTVVVFEFKAGLIDIELTYGTDVVALCKEVDRRYVFGTSKGPKGFKQLAVRVEKILTDPRSYGLRKGIDHVIPVVVVEERFMQSRFAHDYCEEVTAPMFEKFGNRVLRPMILQADDLVKLGLRSNRMGLADCLLRCQQESMGAALTFDQWLQATLSGDGRRLSELGVHLSFLEEAHKKIVDRFTPVPVPTCSCGQTRVLEEAEGMASTWRCFICNEPPIAASPEEVAAFKRAKADAVGRYLSS
jgi:hypothetical protein